MRENRLSGSEGGGAKPIATPYPYRRRQTAVAHSAGSNTFTACDPGACAPGFMLSPASQVYSLSRLVSFRLSAATRRLHS